MTRFFVVGVSIVLILCLGDSPRAQSAATTSSQPEQKEPSTPERVGWLKLSGILRDRPPPFAWLLAEQHHSNLSDIVTQLSTVAQDEEYAGVVIDLDNPIMRLSQIDELVSAIKAIRQKNKRVLVFSSSYDMPRYLLACAADMILLQRRGAIELAGLALEEMYLFGLLEKIGLKADLMQLGRFKGGEAFSRSGPSEAWNQNMDALIDDLYEQMIHRIADGRGLSESEVEQALHNLWLIKDRKQYIDLKLIDRLVERNMVEVTQEQFGKRFEWDEHMGRPDQGKAFNNPLAFLQMLVQPKVPQVHKPSIAIVHLSGPIHTGESSSTGSFQTSLFTPESIGSKTIAKTLAEAKENDMIKGVVLRIDSPGGSALASELIWQAARDLNCQKPVYMSIGSMAASGGYYIASAGREVYANPHSILGSIGVIAGKIAMGGLYEKIGVQTYRRARGPLSGIFNTVEPFSVEQRRALFARMELIYNDFTHRVALGRGQRLKDIDSVGHGRIFSGRQGVRNGLVDKIGGLDAALADLAKVLDLKEGEYEIINLPPPTSFADILGELFGAEGGIPRPGVQNTALVNAAHSAIGYTQWRNVQAVIGGMMLLQREPVLTLFPAVMSVK